MRSPIPPSGVAAAISAVSLGLLSAVASAQSLDALKDHSVIVRDIFNTVSDVEGRTVTGGNLVTFNLPEDAYSHFATKLVGQVDPLTPTLQIGGAFRTGRNVDVAAGSIEFQRNYDFGIMIPYKPPVLSPGATATMVPSLNFTEMFNSLDQASAVLAGYVANSSLQGIPGQDGHFSFNATPDANGVAVFGVSSQVFDNSSVLSLDINPGTARDIVINVDGTNISWVSSQLTGLFEDAYWRSHVIWNFRDATVLNFGNGEMMGQVLAPKASVHTDGPIDGSVYAKGLYTTAIVRLYPYAGNVAVPEASTPLLGGICAALGMMRRRRKLR